MLSAAKLDPDLAMLLVIDLQTKLLPLIPHADDILAATAKLVRGAAIFDVPVLATVQYTRGLGPMHDTVASALMEVRARTLEKAAFSGCGDDAVRAELDRIDRPQIIIAGIETHVCVQQTVIDLLAMGYRTYVCADCVGSRHDLDLDIALSRMQNGGATVTTSEAVLFELCGQSGTPKFKQLLDLIKSSDAADRS